MTVDAAPNLLATIVAATRRAVEVRARACPQRQLDWRSRPPDGAGFARALREAGAPRIIAECKRRSPSRGILRRHYQPADHARSYELAGAAAISVLTEPAFFDGTADHLREVREAVRIPVLRKDFIVTEYQVFEAAALGADAILLIVGALDDAALARLRETADGVGLAALVEVHDLEELRRAQGAGARIIGVNSRNLRTLAVDLSVLDAVAAALPPGVTAVAESGITSGQDMVRLSQSGYHAFLVGERLMTQPDPGQALRELRAAADGAAAPRRPGQSAAGAERPS